MDFISSTISDNVTGPSSTADYNVLRDRTLLAGSVELFLFGVVLLSCCCLTFFCFCTSCACFVKHYAPPREPSTELPPSVLPIRRDKPPTYDEVEQGLPTYQEAVRRLSLVTVTTQTPPSPQCQNVTHLTHATTTCKDTNEKMPKVESETLKNRVVSVVNIKVQTPNL